MANENLLPTNYSNLDEISKTASQIRRASVFIKETSSNSWRLFIINNKFTFEEELIAFANNVDKDECYIHINDSYGNIQRKKVLLIWDDLALFAKLLRNYNPKPQVVTEKFGDIGLRFKKLLEEGNKDKEPELEVVGTAKSGSFRIKPIEILYRYKKFMPSKIVINQQVTNDTYEDFSVDFYIKGMDVLKKSYFILRTAENLNFPEIRTGINNGKYLRIRANLKKGVFEKISKKMLEAKNLDEMFSLKNPLGNFVFIDFSNYAYLEHEIVEII